MVIITTAISSLRCNLRLTVAQTLRLRQVSHRQSCPAALSAALSTKSSSNLVAFKLADIGEGIAEVELMKWFVKEGDRIRAFDRLCEVQSDKATVEITSRYDGIVSKMHHAEGDIVPVGSTLVDIAENLAKDAASSAKLSTERDEDLKLHIPSAAVATTAAAGGKTATSHTSNVLASPQDIVIAPPPVTAVGGDGKVLTTPAVRRIAREFDIDLQRVRGTGPKGRISKEDVLMIAAQLRGSGSGAIAAAASTAFAATSANSKLPSPQPAQQQQQPTPQQQRRRIEAIRGVQRLMLKSMTDARQVQHLTYSEEVTFDHLKQLRNQINSLPKTKSAVGKMSFMPFLIKATSMALMEYPILNTSLNPECTEIHYHDTHNIGVAMDTPRGLLVPVIKGVQSMSVLDIALEMQKLQQSAAAGTLNEAQLSGATFSLSNIGSVGGTYASPVVVLPQVAIGAFGRLQMVPRYVNNKMQPASMSEIESGAVTVAPVTIMNVSWSADHRVIEGATIAKFCNLWKNYVESPTLMLAELR